MKHIININVNIWNILKFRKRSSIGLVVIKKLELLFSRKDEIVSELN